MWPVATDDNKRVYSHKSHLQHELSNEGVSEPVKRARQYSGQSAAEQKSGASERTQRATETQLFLCRNAPMSGTTTIRLLVIVAGTRN